MTTAAALAFHSSGSCAEPLEVNALVDIAERFALPMPPDNGRLVLVHTGYSSVLGDRSTSRDPGIYSPAYLLSEESDSGIRVLWGTTQKTLRPRRNREPLWRPFSTEEVEPKLGGYAPSFSYLSTFVCAVQTAARGDTETAQAIWERFSVAEWWPDAELDQNFYPGQLDDQKLLLARCIFDYLRNSLLNAGVGRNDVHTRMAALLKDFPQLNSGRRGQLFEDLTAAVNAPLPETGSVEAELLDWASRPSKMRHLGMYDEHNKAADAPAREIVARGFDSFPGLIALLDDKRVTAHEQPAIMNAPAHIRRVGELARELIREIAGNQESFPKYEQGTAAIQAWWEQAKTRDEFALLLESVFKRKSGKITGVNEGPVRIVAAKFPDKLPFLCDEFLASAADDAQPWVLAEALAGSNLAKEVRVHELSRCAEQGSLSNKRCFLQNLAKLDQQACTALLLPILERFPMDASGPYWTCPEARFTHVVVQTEDDKVWGAFLRLARECSVGLRMEMMNPLNYSYIGSKNLDRRLAFLSAFLDDQAVRTIPTNEGQFGGPCAGFTIPRLSVQNFAAIKLASLLGMEDSPDEFWTDSQWSDLRHSVKEQLAEMKLPEF